MSGEATMLENYGPFKAGQKYRVLSEGRDYLRVKCRGFVYYVPIKMIEISQWDVDVVKRKRQNKQKHKKK